MSRPIHPAPELPSAIALFARSPAGGRAKTRLIPLLGSAGAARFQAALLADSLGKLARLQGTAAPYLFLAGRSTRVPAGARWASHLIVFRQQGADLGQRLERAFGRLLRRHPAAVVIGTDSPELETRAIRLALRELRACDAVIGRCPDGGYYLVGLGRRALHPLPHLFRGVRWSSRHAFRDTLRNFLDCGLVCSMLEPCPDIDRPRDVMRLARDFRREPRLRRAAPAVWRFLREEVPDSKPAAARAKLPGEPSNE